MVNAVCLGFVNIVVAIFVVACNEPMKISYCYVYKSSNICCKLQKKKDVSQYPTVTFIKVALFVVAGKECMKRSSCYILL